MLKIALFFFLFLPITTAVAQHNHEAGHNSYTEWSSQKARYCCDNRDCGSLEESEWSEGPNGIEVLIDGKSCPVQQQHFITRGKSPDWTKAHACIRPKLQYSKEDPCDRLLCFTGIPKF